MKTSNNRNAPPAPGQPQTVKESPVERVCSYLILALLAYLVSIVPSMLQLQAYYDRNGTKFRPESFLLVLPAFLVIRALFLVSVHWLAPALQPYVKEESAKSSAKDAPRPTEAENLHRLGNYIYQTIFYVVATVWLLAVAIRTNLLPVQLGGPADPDLFCTNWPQPVQFELVVFYMFAIGKNLERIFYEFVDNRQSATFYTMVYHHTLTITLITIALWTHLHKFGVFILLTHDFCDILLNAGRLSKVLLPSFVTNSFNVALLASWGYLRLVVYSRVVLYPMAICYADPDSVFRRFVYPCLFIVPMLTTLFALNAFWFFQILKIGYNRMVKKDYAVLYIEKKKSPAA